MSEDFPGGTKLLGEFLRLKPHTYDGQHRAAQEDANLVQKYNLGSAKILQYPVTEEVDGVEITRDYPLVQILSEFGPMKSNEDRGTMNWLGHLDTVPLKGKQKKSDALIIEGNKGKGRGTLDMWAGNISYLRALRELSLLGNARYKIQTILSSREESGSEVLYQALQNKDLEEADCMAVTEISTDENGLIAPVYHARTGRFGFDVRMSGNDDHAGNADRNPEILDGSCLRYLGRALDELLDDARYFSIDNQYPGDTTGVLPSKSRALPNSITADPDGLSLPYAAKLHFNMFHSDPNLTAEEALSQLRTYLLSDKIKIPSESLQVNLEDRKGQPFTDPWMTEADHPLVVAAHTYAKEISENENLPLGGASGVAEDGMFNIPTVGWSPVGQHAHKAEEWVDLSSIRERTLWLNNLASHESSLT